MSLVPQVNNQLHEYCCHTCKVNHNIEGLDTYERIHKRTFIPLQIRWTKKIGQIFTDTKGDTLYEWHLRHGKHHDWFNVAKAEADIKAINDLQNKLDRMKTI